MAKKAKISAAPLGLVGRCFVQLGGANEVICQGMVRGQVGETHFLVQYEGSNGSRGHMQVVDFEEMIKPTWRFYEDAYQMEAAT